MVSAILCDGFGQDLGILPHESDKFGRGIRAGTLWGKGLGLAVRGGATISKADAPLDGVSAASANPPGLGLLPGIGPRSSPLHSVGPRGNNVGDDPLSGSLYQNSFC